MMGLAVHRMGIGPAAGGVTPPLDGLTTNIWAAWSTRQLLSTWTGSVIRVRRSSDSTEQDIGTSGGLLDEAALTAFVGAAYGYVVKMYDQTGNGRDLSLSTAQAPVIVILGTVQYLSGIACLNYNVQAVLKTAVNAPTSFVLFSSLSTTDAFAVFVGNGAGGGGSTYLGAWANGSTASINSTWTGTVHVDGVDSSTNRDVLHDAIAIGAPVIGRATASSVGTNPVSPLGYDSSTYCFGGKTIDSIVYTSTSEAVDIEAALGAAL